MDFEEIGTVSTFGEAKPGDLMLIAFGDEDVVASKVVIGDQNIILMLEPTNQGHDNVCVSRWNDEFTSVLLLKDFHFRLLMPEKTNIGVTAEADIGLGQITKTPDGHIMRVDLNSHLSYLDLGKGEIGRQPHPPYVIFREWEIRHKTNKNVKPIATFPFPKRGKTAATMV